MTRNERRNQLILTMIILVTVGIMVTFFWRTETPEPLPSDEEDSLYAEWLSKYHPDSSQVRPYGERGRKSYPGRSYPLGKHYTKKHYERRSPSKSPTYVGVSGDSPAPASFAFDPNTADSTELLALGLSPYQVRNVYKYRAKGGRYHRKEDFHRLYGLTVEQWQHLEPLIVIDEKYQYVADLAETSPHYVKDSVKRVVKYDEGVVVPLNRCDTSDLQKVPGIGSYYARKIVGYRDALGGFVSAEQLTEVKDLPREVAEETTRWFQTEPSLVRKMAVNEMSLSQLKKHPYLSFYQAKVITEHRRLYGPLKSLDDLKLYEEFTERDIERLRPYIQF